MKQKLLPVINGLKSHPPALLGLVLAVILVVVASWNLLHPAANTPGTTPKASQVVINGSDFTISDPAKISFDGTVLKLVDQGGSTYPTDNPYVTSTNPVSFTEFAYFGETLGSNNQGSIKYQLSLNGSTWYWWNGTAWASTASGYTNSNTATEIKNNIATFDNQVGSGNLYVRAFLHSDGTQRTELQKVTLNTSTDPAPTLTSVSPSHGPITGGTSVTLTGTDFTTASSSSSTTTNVWTKENSAVLGGGKQYRSLAVANGRVYLYGGYRGTAGAYSAPLSNPVNFTAESTGSDLSGSMCCTRVTAIGSKLYIFGAYQNGTILETTTSNPMGWQNKGNMPNVGSSQVEGTNQVVVGGTVYHFEAGKIYTAPAANPYSFQLVQNKTYSGSSSSRYPLIAHIGSQLYMYVGTKILTATTADPTTWTTTAKTFPAGATVSSDSNGGQIGIIGNTIYLYYGNKSYSADISDPTTFADAGTLPFTASNASWALIGSKMYLFATDTNGSVYSAPVNRTSPNVYNDPWLTDWETNLGLTDVKFGGVSATNLRTLSPTSATADVPAHAAGAVDVEVTAFGGQTGTLTNGYTYDPPPSAVDILPNTGAVTGGDTVTVNGSNFVNGATVSFGGTASSNVTYIDSHTLSVVTPAQTAGAKNVVITNPDGQAVTLTGGFTYLDGPPAASRISPSSGSTLGGTNVTITGSNFIGPMQVKFDGVAATNVQFVNSTTVKATTPAHSAGVVSVAVSNYDGQVSTLSFTYIAPPNPTGVSPSSGSTVGGDSVTISGTGFANGATVKFGGAAATNVQFVNSTTITATTPTNRGGLKNVIVTNPDGQAGTLVGGFTYVRPPPTISAISPNKGSMEGGSTVTVTGTGFGSNDVARIDSGATASAQSSYQTQTPDKVFDNDDTTYWDGPGGTGQWVQSMFDSTYTIQKIGWNKCGSDTAPYEVQIQLHQNGSWVTYKQLTSAQVHLGSSSGDSTGELVLSPSQAADGIRMYANNAGGWMLCYSMHAYSDSPLYSLSFGGTPATNVNYVNPTTLQAVVPAHTPGQVDVILSDENNQTATLTNGYTYLPAGYAFTTAPLNLSATEPGTMTVRAVDGSGNPVTSSSNITLDLTTSSNTGFFARDLNEDESTRWNYSSVVLPAGQSQVTFYYKDNTEGTPTVTVKDPNNTSVQQVQNIGPRYKLLITGITDPGQAGVPSSVTVQAVDYTGQPQSDYTGTVHFTSTDARASLPPDFTFTPAMLGLKTFVNGVNMATQGEWCVTATDVNKPTITGSQCDITVTPPNAGTISKLKIITQPQSFAAGGHSSAITVQTQDVNGLPIPVASDTTVYVYSSSGSGSFSLDGETGWTGGSPFQVVIPQGTTTANVYYKDTTVGTHTITMRDDAGTGQDFGWQNDSQSITVGVGAPAKLGVTAPSAAAAGEWTPVTVHLRDSANNDVTSFKNVTAHLTSNSASALFSLDPSGSNPAGTINAVIPIGSSTVTVYTSETTSRQLILTATDTSPPGNNPYDPGSATIEVGPAAPVKLAFLPVSNPLRVHEAQQLSAYLQDVYGNTAFATATTQVDFSSSSSGGSFSTSASGPWNGTATATILPGASTATMYYQDTSVGTPTVTAAANGLTSGQLPLSVVAGPYNGDLHFSVAPAQFTAGQAQNVTVELLDDYTNPTTADTPVNLTLTASSNTGEFSLDGNTWSATLNGTVPAGQGSLTVQYRDTKAGSVTIGVQETGRPATYVSYQPTVIAAAPSQYHFTSASQVIAKNTPSGPITIELQDQYGNTAAASSTFNASISTASGSGQLSLNSTSGWTSSPLTLPFTSGSTTQTVYYRDSSEGIFNLSVSGNGYTGDTQSIQVVEGIVGRLAITAPGTAEAGTPVPVTVATQTAAGLPAAVLADTTISLSGPGEFSLSQNPWTPISSVTITAGQTNKQLYYKGITSGVHTLNAHENPSQGWQAGSATITVGPSEFYKLAFTSHPASVPVTEASGNFTVTAQDVYGNVVTTTGNTPVYLYSDANSGSFSGSASGPWNSTSATIAAGASSASFYYRDTGLGTAHITGSDHTPLDNPDMDIVNATAAIDVVGQQASQLQFTTGEQTIAAGGLSSAITIQLQKGDGSPAIQGADVTFTFDGAGPGSDPVYFAQPDLGSSPITQVTVPRGQSSVTFYASSVTSGVKEMHSYAFGYPGVGLIHARQNLNVQPGAPDSLVFTTPPQSIHTNEDSAQIKVELRDALGNKTTAVSAAQLNLASSCGSGSFSLAPGASWNPTTSVQLSAGQSEVYFYYRDAASGTCNLTLSGVGLQSAQQSIEVTYSAATQLSFTSAPQTLTAGQTSNNITVSVKDMFGNITVVDTDTTVYFSTSSLSGELSQNSAVILTGQSSVTFTYRDTKPGTHTLTARDQLSPSDGGLTDAQQSITYNAGTPTKLAFEPATFNTAAGQLRQLKVTVLNQYDAPVTAASAVTVGLSTSAGDGSFKATNNANAPDISQVTIPAGDTSATMYYRQLTAGSATLTAVDNSSSLASGTATATIYADNLKGMRFVGTPQTLEANQPSAAMTVQAIDNFGNATLFSPVPMTLYLYSSSTSGKFYADSSLSTPITSLTISSTSGTASFYYRDTALGTATITVSDQTPLDNPDQGLTNAVQSVSIIPGTPAKLHITDESPEFERGGTTEPVHVALMNAYDHEITSIIDRTVYLSSTSGTGQFAVGPDGPWQSTQALTLPAGQSRVAFYYRDDTSLGTATLTASDVSAPPESPDTNLVNGSRSINVVAGTFAQLAFQTNPQTITARHPSGVMTVQVLNRYGKPTTVTADTPIYLRSTSAAGEFASTAGGPWGISSVTLPSGQATASFYYRDSREGAPTLTASNSLSTDPAQVIKTTQQQTIQRQTLSHFLVTNVSDPQYQGNPSSIVVAAVDADNFVIDWYDGTVTFGASDGNAVLPSSYTFKPSTDKGIHTFTNGVAFKSTGEKTVTVTDSNNISGQQADITVLANPAGPPAKLVFIAPPAPLTAAKNTASEIITLQVQDSSNQPTNAGPGGFPVRLSVDAGTGEFALSPNGPWQSSPTFTVPQGLSYLNLYYRDASVGNRTITARDWISGTDNPAISNATLPAVIQATQLSAGTLISSQDYSGAFVLNGSIFANNHLGGGVGRVNFSANAKDEGSGSPEAVDWQLNWKNGAGTTLEQQSFSNTSQITYQPADVSAQAGDSPFSLDIATTDPVKGYTAQLTRTVPVSPWAVRADAPTTFSAGTALKLAIAAKQLQAPADPAQGTVQLVDQNLQPIAGTDTTLDSAKQTDTGTYEVSMLPTNLIPGQSYRALVHLSDIFGNTIAEDLSDPFTAAQTDGGNTGGGSTTDPASPGNSGSNSGTSQTPVTPDNSGTPTITTPEQTTNQPQANANQNTPGSDTVRNEAGEASVWSTLGKSIKRFLAAPATPAVVSNSLFLIVISLAAILLWQAYKELQNARWLLAILAREKQTADDKDSFLQICAHYLRTPITIISSSSELLVSKLGNSHPESIESLKTVNANLKQKVEQILAETTQNKQLESIAAPDLKSEKFKAYTSPVFWLPIALSVVLTIAINIAASTIGGQSLSGGVWLEQILIAAVAIILLYSGLRLRAMRKRRRQKLAEALEQRGQLDTAKNQFVLSTYELLASDVYKLSQVQSTLPSDEKFAQMLGQGTQQLEKLMDKFQLLSTIDTTQLHANDFTVRAVVDQAVGELTKELETKQLQVVRNDQAVPLHQDSVLLERVISSVLANAAEYSQAGGQIEIESQSGGDSTTLTIRDNGPGFPQDPSELFEEFKRGTSTLQYDHEGIGLDLYLDRLIMRHLGGTIFARNLQQGAEVTLTLPSQGS